MTTFVEWNRHCVQLACIWEATARKLGNVHRFSEWENLSYLDFLHSALAIAPVLAHSHTRPLGETILQAIQATQSVVKTNTNLGIVLLLAPLAGSADREELTQRLQTTTVADSVCTFAAIRCANPGGMGKVEDQDLADPPTEPLHAIMGLAKDRDWIARQYVTGFADLFDFGLPSLLAGWDRYRSLEAAILHCQLDWLATFPDSLIARKWGIPTAEEVRQRAAALRAIGLATPEGIVEFRRFDAWLRDKNQRRNPGTSADFITACLFLALRERRMDGTMPFTWNLLSEQQT